MPTDRLPKNHMVRREVKQKIKYLIGYLVIDMHAASDPSLRLRTGIFKEDNEEGESIIFIPKNGLA